MSPQVWWYVSRSSGIVAWALVSASVVFGLWVALRLTRTPRPAWVLDVHRFLGGLSVVFVGVHLAGLVADSYVDFGLREIFVPFASGWKPVAVAWGVVGLYLLLAIEVTSLFMKHLPRRFWHAVHLSSFVLFAVATVHMFTAGTDAGSTILQWCALAVTGLVVFLTVARVLGGRKKRKVVVPRPARAPDAAPPAFPAPRPAPEPVASIRWTAGPEPRGRSSAAPSR